MPGTDDRAGAPGARPAAGGGQSRGGSAKDVSHGATGENKPFSGGGRDGLHGGTAALGQDRNGRTALGQQTVSGAVDQHESGTRGRPFQPPAILRAASSLVSHPLFLHPIPQLGVPFRAPPIPPSLPAPILFAPSVGAPQPPVPIESAAAQTQTPDVAQTTQPPADVPSPKVELSVTSAIDTAPTSIETTSSAVTVSSGAPSLQSAIASTTSDSAPDISPIIVPAASLVDTSFANPDILPVTNSGVGVGGKVAAACVIGAVLLLLVNWAFWLLIRRRRRARRSFPAHWDFAAPPPAKGDAGRDSEDAFEHTEDAGRDAKGGMVTVPV